MWWVERPNVGRRPHLIVTRDAAIPVLNSLIAVPATRTVRGIETEVPLLRDEGMPSDCVLSLDNLSRVPKAFFVERICELRGDLLAQVCRALAYATDCD
jgi:mRNA interferase MazF